MRQSTLIAVLVLIGTPLSWADTSRFTPAICGKPEILKMDMSLGAPAVSLEVGGVDMLGVIDTGTSDTIVNDTNFATLGGKPRDENVNAKSLVGVLDVKVGSLSDIKIGGCAVPEMRVLAATGELSASPLNVINRPGRMMLGRDFLGQFDWTFDFEHREIRISPVSAERWIDRRSQAWTAPVRLGSKVETCLLDTGLNYPRLFVLAGDPIATSLLSNASKTLQAPHSASLTGTATEVMVRSASVQGLDGSAMVIDIEEKTAQTNLSDRDYCIVGTGLLAKSTVSLLSSQRDAKIQGKLPAPYYNRSGVAGVDLDGLGASFGYVVTDLVPGGSMEKSGVHKGDKIVAINGREASDVSVEQLRDYFSQPAGTQLHLIVRRGANKLPLEVKLLEPLG